MERNLGLIIYDSKAFDINVAKAYRYYYLDAGLPIVDNFEALKDRFTLPRSEGMKDTVHFISHSVENSIRVGDGGLIIFKDEELTPDECAQKFIAAGVTPHNTKEIVLLICNSGVSGFAQIVSDLTRIPVLAPMGYPEFTTDGQSCNSGEKQMNVYKRVILEDGRWVGVDKLSDSDAFKLFSPR